MCQISGATRSWMKMHLCTVKKGWDWCQSGQQMLKEQAVILIVTVTLTVDYIFIQHGCIDQYVGNDTDIFLTLLATE